MTSRKNKREVAPPLFQAGSAAPPWLPDGALSSALPSGGDAMPPHTGSQAGNVLQLLTIFHFPQLLLLAY